MSAAFPLPLFAVHIADGILTWPWLAGGFIAAGVLALFGAWKIRDEEIAPVALLTAAFFVASSMHVRVPPTSVHPLLNGLVGVILGRRAAVAIPVGLFLQAALMNHGGFTSLGVNSCVMVLPALIASWMFAVLQRLPWVRHPWFRTGLIGTGTLIWTLSLVFGMSLLLANTSVAWAIRDAFANLLPLHLGSSELPSGFDWASALTFHPFTLLAAGALAVIAGWAEQRLENAPEFPIGMIVGQLAVLATVSLNALVLAWSGKEDWQTLAQLVFLVHLPLAAVEGIILGFTVGFLARVKPEMLGMVPAEKSACATDPLS